MKRISVKIAKILLFTVCFAAAFWYFLDWQSIGTFLLTNASSYASRNGTRITFSGVSGTDSGFTVHNLSVNGRVSFTFSSLTITPRIIASIANLSLVADLAFNDANVRFGQTLNFGNGGMTGFARPSSVHVENLRTNGDFSVSGTITYDVSTGRIARASARLNMPPQWQENISLLQGYLPIVREGENWYLRR